MSNNIRQKHSRYNFERIDHGNFLNICTLHLASVLSKMTFIVLSISQHKNSHAAFQTVFAMPILWQKTFSSVPESCYLYVINFTWWMTGPLLWLIHLLIGHKMRRLCGPKIADGHWWCCWSEDRTSMLLCESQRPSLSTFDVRLSYLDCFRLI